MSERYTLPYGGRKSTATATFSRSFTARRPPTQTGTASAGTLAPR